MNKKKNKLIPELRFPEFKNEGEWEEKKISDLGETISGLTGKSGEDFGTGKPYVTYKQVFDHSIIDFDKCAKVQIGKNENQNSLQRGDILFTTSSETPNEVGFASVLIKSPNEEIYLNSFCFALRPFDIEKIQPQFSRYLFHSPIYRKSVTAIAQGSTRYNLSKGAFLELQVPLPKPQEQQKIASCLSSLDEVISAHSQKLDLLKDHKKGLMQNLFPQDGEKVPKFRFKEFEKDGEWVEKTIEQVFSIFQGYAFSSGDTVASGIRWLKIADVGIQEMKNDTPSFLPVNFQEEHKRFLVKKGDYVLALTRPILSGNLKIAPIDQIYHNSLLNQRVGKLVTEHNSTFIYYLIQTSNMVKSINSNIAGNEPPNLSFQQISDIEVFIPSKEEQQKIASTLSSLDELITAQAEKIEQLKEHKKGLMQGLFPEVKS